MCYWTLGLNAMRSHVALGVMILTCCGFIPVSFSKECDPSKDVQLVQVMCKDVNEILLKADLDHDHVTVCRYIILFLKCVATNASWCFDFFSEMNSYYFHSPHNCELTAEQVMELQEIQNNKTQVTVVPLSPSTSSTLTSTPSTTKEDDHSKETGGGGTSPQEEEEGETTSKRDGANEGNKEEQKGSENGAPTTLLSSMSVVMLVLMSHSLSWRLAS